MKTVLIIGAGPAGCAVAHQIRLKLPEWTVIIVEWSGIVGAGARTSWYGGHPYTFGPRHFLTAREDVWKYMNEFCPLRSCGDHEFKTYVEQDERWWNFPIHEDDIEMMPDCDIIKYERLHAPTPNSNPANLEEFWTDAIGYTLYEKMIGPYSEKMWQMPARLLDTFNWSPKGSLIKSGPRAAWDSKFSGYPKDLNGYNTWFDRCLDGVKLFLHTTAPHFYQRRDYFEVLLNNGVTINADVVISTLSPDVLCNYKFKKLKYIGRDFHKIMLPIEFALPEHVYFTYEGGAEKWTRLTEYKKFTGFKDSKATLLSIEIPSENGKHYPIPTKAAQAEAKKYFNIMPKNFYSIGRHGTYRYEVDIAVCIEQSMALVENIKNGWEHPLPLERFRS